MRMPETTYKALQSDMAACLLSLLKAKKLSGAPLLSMRDMWRLWGRVEQEKSYHPESGLRDKLALLTGVPLALEYVPGRNHGAYLEGLKDAHAATAFKRMLPELQKLRA